MNKVEILHQANECKRKQNGYSDPETGFFVLTEYYLEQKGHCCGAVCRHCPYDAAEQRRAGREVITSRINECSDTNKANKTEQDTTKSRSYRNQVKQPIGNLKRRTKHTKSYVLCIACHISLH